VLCCAASGKKAYERGQYENSVSFLEQAVEKAGKATILGGEAMMWLALAYQVRSSSSSGTFRRGGH
jgi:NADH:ubiquinone oxidoreductase subunit F (NADH-binding)